MIFALLAALIQIPGARPLCEPGPEVQRYARQQEQVFERGIEGDLKAMLVECARLQAEHPDDAGYAWLLARAHLGRGTRTAMALLRDLRARAPQFAPARGTLAEIYGSEVFRDEEKERVERAQFLTACPGAAIARRPAPLPPHSPLFAQQREPRTVEEVERALQQEEWRAQRVRLFDWYTAAQKQQAIEELHRADWRAWGLLVRLHRREGRGARADALLAEMEDRLLRLQQRGDPGFDFAARTLLGLYAEAREGQRVRAALQRMRDAGGQRSGEVASLEAAFAR